jgi:hypothetical protein
VETFAKLIVGFVVPLAENRKGFPVTLTLPDPVFAKTSELSWKSLGLSLFAVNVPLDKAPLKVTDASEALTGLFGDHPGPFSQVTVPLAVAFETVGYNTAVIATVCVAESPLGPVGL